jgi:mono/diheme cytochrome c family protein
MKSALIAAAAIVLGLLGVSAAASAATPKRVDDFQLTDQTRLAHQLYYYRYAPAIVLMSQSNGSAASRASAVQLGKLAEAYKAKGVLFFMINSNLSDSREAVAAEARAQGFTIPVLMDEQQLVGEQLGIERDGEVFVVDPKGWKPAYHGPAASAGAAIDAVLAGQPVADAQIAIIGGSPIAFPARAQAASFARISYAREVAPILQDKCASCHIKGGIGPFAMDGYPTVRGFSQMIRETIRTKRMPPYFADPHIGRFKHDQSLSAEQARTIVHWIEAGAPRGDGPDPLLANAGKTAPDWPTELGKPDVVLDLPAFDVPATGLVEYQNPRVANPFTQDTWLKAVAIKPGDRSVLHHVVSDYVADRSRPAPAIPGGSVGSYTPGARPQVMAEGAGAPVPAGGQLHFQLHYTTTGKATTDRTQVGFYTLKSPPKYIKRSAVIGDFSLYIPAGEARHQEIAYLTFPADAWLYTLYPHAHYRGMHVELKARTADGKETMLISLPKYDFNWQRDYDPVKPILVKAGTKLIATWVYDNSPYNKANPDPKRNVTWGEQTPDEMMYFRVNYRWVDETAAKPRNDLQTALMSSLLMGALDDNIDDRIQPEELKGPIGAGIKARFAALDANKDGALDAAEMAATTRGALRLATGSPNL